MRKIIAFLILLPSLSSLAVERKILHCGNLFDSQKATLVGPHTILVENDIVKSVTPGLGKNVGENTLIDLSEYTCLPGFIDLHVHLSSESNPDSYSEKFRLDDVDFILRSVRYAEKTLFAGFTTVRDLGGKNSRPLRDAINRGLIKGPRVYAAIKSIASTGGHGDTTNGLNEKFSHLVGNAGPGEGVVNSVDDARKAVRQAYKDGSDVIKITATGGVLSYAKSADAPQFTVDEISEIVAIAKDYGMRVAAHAHGKEGAKRAVLAGVTSIEHGSFMDDDVFRLMKKFDTWYVPTLSAGKFVSEKAKVDGYYPEIVRPKAMKVSAQMQETFRKAYSSGVKIAFGTDAGVGYHGDNASEFLLMTQGGMPSNIALQSATYEAAKVLGNSELGRIAEGMKADVIALKGDPTKDIRATQKMSFVMKDGVVYLVPVTLAQSP